MPLLGNKRLGLLHSFVMILVNVTIGVTKVEAAIKNQEPCPSNWTLYNEDLPHMCVAWGNGSVHSMLEAHEECVALDSSLIVVSSQKKYEFFKEFLNDKIHRRIPVWLGLQKFDDEITWLTKDGNVSADWAYENINFDVYTRHDPRYYYVHYDDNYDSSEVGDYNRGLLFRYNEIHPSNYYRNAEYICEKSPGCKEGWFGGRCDKECHCYEQKCDVTALEITCDHGCEIGWMGEDCTQPKPEADVKYFCVNSPEQGMYAYVRIQTHGVNYRNIEAIDDNGYSMTWCNTSIHRDLLSGNVGIKIYIDTHTGIGILNGHCAGKIAANGNYEWIIKIQEIPGIVSRNDQDVHIECDFRNADDLRLSGDRAIKRERNFRRKDIRKNVLNLTEKKELVFLSVVDPSTGQSPTTAQKLGSPVVVMIGFGFGKANIATGVLPFNCNVTSDDDLHSITFVDGRGCPIEGGTISGFHRHSSNSIATKPFPLFGFEKSTKVVFACSYSLCFGDDPCMPDCTDKEEHSTFTTPVHTSPSHFWSTSSTTDGFFRGRRRRDVRDVAEEEMSVAGSISLAQ